MRIVFFMLNLYQVLTFKDLRLTAWQVEIKVHLVSED
jgi:hypothetical protein